MRGCPYCTKEIQDEAIKCRYCKKEFISSVQIRKAIANKKVEPQNHIIRKTEKMFDSVNQTTSNATVSGIAALLFFALFAIFLWVWFVFISPVIHIIINWLFS